MLASGYFFKVLRIDAFQQKQRETGRVSPESKTGTDRTHSSQLPFYLWIYQQAIVAAGYLSHGGTVGGLSMKQGSKKITAPNIRK